VNDRGPFSPGRIIDLSYTAALKLGVLNGVTPVEITRITQDDIRTGAAFSKSPTLASDKPAMVAVGDQDRLAATTRAKPTSSVVTPLPPSPGDVVATAVDPLRPAAAVGAPSATPAPGVDLGAAAAADAASAVPGAVTTVSETVVASAAPASAPDKPDEHARADTTAGIGWWIQLGAFKQRDGALDFQRRLIDEQPWLAPLLAVFTDRGLNKLQAGPYVTREDARSAAERIRSALQLVPTIVEKR
jgi:rare lipoprotein A